MLLPTRADVVDEWLVEIAEEARWKGGVILVVLVVVATTSGGGRGGGGRLADAPGGVNIRKTRGFNEIAE